MLKAFTTTQLLSESAKVKVDTLNSFSDKKSASKTQLKLESASALDDKIIAAKMKYYKTIMESNNNQFIIEDAKKEMEETINDANEEHTAFIHGLEIDADTIFDKNAEKDGQFNKTDWMDLALESCYEYDRAIKYNELYRYLQEAQIFCNPDSSFKDLAVVNEAVVNRIKNAIEKIKAAIKKIIATFIEKLRAIGKNNIPYLKKYKDTIVAQQPKDEIIKIRDFETAIKRIMSVTVPNIRYQQVKNILDKSKDDDDPQLLLFDQLFTPSINGMNNIKFGPNDSIADKCKTYFCCSEQAPMIERSMKTFNMTDIYNFLIDSNSIINQINKDMKALETNANMIATAAEKEVAQQENNNPKPNNNQQQNNNQNNQQQNTNQNNQQTQQNASAILFNDNIIYSSIMESYITIQEFETVKQNSTAGGNTTMGDRMKNVSGDTYKDQDSANNDVKDKNWASDKTRNYVIAYVKVAQTILTAKITAVEFFQNELFKLVRHHVKNFINDETTPTAAQPGTV